MKKKPKKTKQQRPIYGRIKSFKEGWHPSDITARMHDGGEYTTFRRATELLTGHPPTADELAAWKRSKNNKL